MKCCMVNLFSFVRIVRLSFLFEYLSLNWCKYAANSVALLQVQGFMKVSSDLELSISYYYGSTFCCWVLIFEVGAVLAIYSKSFLTAVVETFADVWGGVTEFDALGPSTHLNKLGILSLKPCSKDIKSVSLGCRRNVIAGNLARLGFSSEEIPHWESTLILTHSTKLKRKLILVRFSWILFVWLRHFLLE